MFKQALMGLAWFAAGLCTAITINSVAQPYLVVGLGKGELRHPGSNYWWIQDGFAATIDSKSNVWNLGVGYNFGKYLAAEVNYHDLGEYHHFAGFIEPEANYAPWFPNFCNGPCPPTQWGYLQGSATALSLTIVPKYPLSKDLTVFARWGMAYVDAQFRAFVTTGQALDKGYHFHDYSQRLKTKTYGFGFQYRRVSIEQQFYPEMRAQGDGCCSAYTSARTLSISYRWDL